MKGNSHSLIAGANAMSYVIDVTLSLTRCLEGASFFRDERLKGYAANAAFWAREVRHALDVIESCDSRSAAWRRATGSTSTSSPISPDDQAKLKHRLITDATRFFRLCRPHLERGTILEIEQLLGIDIEHVSHQDRD